jgi:hypothetical protein
MALKLAFWTIKIVFNAIVYLFSAYRRRAREQAEPTLEQEG